MADEVVRSFEAFDKALTDFEKVLRPLLQALEKAQAEDSEVGNVTAARIHATLAYTVNALYYVYLRANNNDDDDDDNSISNAQHPVQTELERTQRLFVKLRTVDRKVSGNIDERKLVHGLQVSAEKLDQYLTPTEENLSHALRGNLEARQRHKLFTKEENTIDVEMTPSKSAKQKKSKSKKAAREESLRNTKKKRKARKSDDVDGETPDGGSAKKKRKSSKEETPSTVVEPEEDTPVKKSSRKKKREKTAAN